MYLESVVVVTLGELWLEIKGNNQRINDSLEGKRDTHLMMVFVVNVDFEGVEDPFDEVENELRELFLSLANVEEYVVVVVVVFFTVDVVLEEEDDEEEVMLFFSPKRRSIFHSPKTLPSSERQDKATYPGLEWNERLTQ